MKKSVLLFLFTLPFILTSCDFLEKFDHFGVGNTFEKSFEISVPEGTTSSYEGSVIFQASDDATIDDNLNNIQEFEVNKISVKVTSFEGDPTATAVGHFEIRGDGNQLIGTPLSLNLDLNSDEEVELELLPSTLASIKDAYLNKEKIRVTANGSVSSTPIDVEITIYMTIEATISN